MKHYLLIILPLLFVACSSDKQTESVENNRESGDAIIIKATKDFSKPEPYEALPAGAATYTKKLTQDAFSHASANMSFERELDFKIGNAFFRKIWVSSPSSTKSSDGLGPLFNARSCQRCHIKDGRGHPPENEHDNAVSMLMRMSIEPQTQEQKLALRSGKVASINEPVYGGQLQDFSVAGVFSEGKISISYNEIVVKLSGGETAALRKPKYQLTNLKYGDLHKHIMKSPRVAPQMIGLGLLEAISEKDILNGEDIDDANNDGISGKANWVWNSKSEKFELGRFGLKAGQPSLTEQNQAAFSGDMGLSTPRHLNSVGDCTEAQQECLKMPNGNDAEHGNVEVSQMIIDKVEHYTRNLAVPARRNVGDKDVLAGKELFYQSGCINCHTPKFITPKEGVESEQTRQLIWPYTDMLLHDMGKGLADKRPEAKANGQEWRTSPLWGIGLTPLVNGHSYYLHDGRARNILEAILWHGGEAENAKNKVVNMSKQQRQKLIKFVKSL